MLLRDFVRIAGSTHTENAAAGARCRMLQAACEILAKDYQQAIAENVRLAAELAEARAVALRLADEYRSKADKADSARNGKRAACSKRDLGRLPLLEKYLGRKWSPARIAREIGVPETTVRRSIERLQAAGLLSL